MQDICCREKDHLGEIIGNLKVVIGKGMILLGVQHFQQCCGRITSKVRADLIYFVQHKQWVTYGCCLHRLDDATGQCSHIGAAMSTYLSFVVYSSQRQAYKLSVECLRNGATK